MKLTVICVQSDKYGSGDLFMQADKVLGFNSWDDAKWRQEYFNQILESFGVEIECVELEDETTDYILGKCLGY